MDGSKHQRLRALMVMASLAACDAGVTGGPRAGRQDDDEATPGAGVEPIDGDDPLAPFEPPPAEPEAALRAGAVMPVHALAGSSMAPRLAIGAAGNALAVWTQQRNVAPYYALFSSHYTAEQGWAEPIAVTQWVATMPTEVTLAGDADGRAVVAWVEGGVLASAFEPERGWSEPVTLAPAPASGFVRTPRVAVSASGEALVAWAAGDGQSAELVVRARSRQSDGGWADTIELVTSGVATYSEALFEIAIDPIGRALVAWVFDTEHGFEVWARRGGQLKCSAAPIGWGSPEQIVARAGGTSDARRVLTMWAGLDGTGRAEVAWAEIGAEVSSVAGASASPEAPFAAAATIADDLPSMFGYEMNTPQLAMGPTGDMLLAWRHSDVTDWAAEPPLSSMLAKRRTAAGAWGGTEVVADDLAPPYFGCAMSGATRSDVDIDSSGRATVVLEERSAGAAQPSILVSAYAPGRGWAQADVLRSDAPGWDRELTTALGSAGGITLWTEDGNDAVTGDWQRALWAGQIVALTPL